MCFFAIFLTRALVQTYPIVLTHCNGAPTSDKTITVHEHTLAEHRANQWMAYPLKHAMLQAIHILKTLDFRVLDTTGLPNESIGIIGYTYIPWTIHY